MIKLKDLLLEKKEVISIEKSQDMRKSGYWTLLTRNLKKVIAVDKDEKPIDEPKTSKGKTKSDTKVSAEPQKSQPQEKNHSVFFQQITKKIMFT